MPVRTNADLATYNIGKKLKAQFKRAVAQRYGDGKQQVIARALFRAFVDGKIEIALKEVVAETQIQSVA